MVLSTPNFNVSHLLAVGGISLATGCFLGAMLTSASLPKPKARATRDAAHPSFSDSYSSSDEEYSDEESEDEVEINSKSLNEIPGEVRMALVVRTDLRMGKGKAAAQCAHAAVGCYRKMTNVNAESGNLVLLNRWLKAGQAKITLQCPHEDEMELLFAKAMSLNVNATIIHDAGRTQIAAGSATVLGLGPAPRSVLDEITGGLKLY
ncbi:hypothetical protein BABINDRAFT_8634 [Babjeviella inositovora NRRL Y-12698]|uniref:peptidyl-tRNA hydrolase n=1 Tax=Babjeviella inositovora NRRL Y-12698 TaxID=984486 RepID=A0A1E3QMR8_9ASCO|nr:uncharacterized protein BABINDRAFT_8634 [Babjeviella inositovora NRRL Y-12698]ODQ79016.1 hypothetical protein BABINDRAFT_8634 [Babjeviella inositovora NRRL Y-12698]